MIGGNVAQRFYEPNHGKYLVAQFSLLANFPFHFSFMNIDVYLLIDINTLYE